MGERVMTCSSLFSHQQQPHAVYPALMVSAKEAETPTFFRS